MNIFKDSYKIVRENSDEIYKGFGFRHLSDATQYYVHPKNQSYRGTTTLCQPIGEGISIIGVALEEEKGDTECYEALKEVYDRVIDVDDMKHLTTQLLNLISRLFI